MSGAPSLFIPDPHGLLVPRLATGVQFPSTPRQLPAPAPRNLVERYATHPEALREFYVEDPVHGHYLKSREHLLLHRQSHAVPRQQQLLAWLRDHVHHEIPRTWYRLVLGHDLHIGTYATLHVQHYHTHFLDPFSGQLGWWENVGLVSQDKVGVPFRDFEIDQLQSESSVYGDFKWHEVGLSATADVNTDTALLSTTAIARVAGTQTEVSASEYRSVATITADTTETWQEHGVFNAATGPTLADRNLVSPTAAVVNLDTVAFTWTMTKTAEA